MAQITYQSQHSLQQGYPTMTAGDSTLSGRNQFISTYKIKKLQRTTTVDHAWSAQSSHTDWADCKLDAAFYTQPRLGPRSDVAVYISLYGLEPRVVERMDYAPAIMLLNLCATVIATENHTPANEFLLQFMVFLNAFEESGYEGGYLEVDSSPVRTEHMQLLYVLKREVQSTVEG